MSEPRCCGTYYPTTTQLFFSEDVFSINSSGATAKAQELSSIPSVRTILPLFSELQVSVIIRQLLFADCAFSEGLPNVRISDGVTIVAQEPGLHSRKRLLVPSPDGLPYTTAPFHR